MLERLVHKADFERLLAARSRLRSAHFALHHVAGGPAVPKKPSRLCLNTELSTGPVGNPQEPVENFTDRHWLGCVVPKRHARRAVTRTLIKRQMRSVFERHTPGLPAGLWLLRLSQGFAVSEFVSARSAPLARAVRHELETLLLNVLKRGKAGSPTVPPAATPAASGAATPSSTLSPMPSPIPSTAPGGSAPALSALPGAALC